MRAAIFIQPTKCRLTTMNTPVDEDYVFNFKLSKWVGLYQILDPTAAKLYDHNVYHIIVIIFSVYICSISAMCPICLYYLTNDAIAFSFYFGSVEQFLFAVFKILRVVYHSKDLWKCITNTSFKTMSYGRHSRIIFERWQAYSTKIAISYTVLVCVVLLIWMSNPFVFNTTMISVKNLDSSYSNYRLNIFNVSAPISDRVYNRYFILFYIMDFIILIAYLFFITIYDICMVMICCALSCQLETINESLRTLGHNNTRSVEYFSEYAIRFHLYFIIFTHVYRVHYRYY